MLRLILGLCLIALPLLELALLIKAGQLVGFWATFALVVASAILGAMILSRQSLATMRRALQETEAGRPPVTPVLEGAFMMMAGVLLITPGFVTDALALVLLIPAVRRALASWTARRMLQRSGSHTDAFGTRDGQAGGPPRSSTAAPGGGPVIEGEFERLGEKPADPKPADR